MFDIATPDHRGKALEGLNRIKTDLRTFKHDTQRRTGAVEDDIEELKHDIQELQLQSRQQDDQLEELTGALRIDTGTRVPQLLTELDPRQLGKGGDPKPESAPVQFTGESATQWLHPQTAGQQAPAPQPVQPAQAPQPVQSPVPSAIPWAQTYPALAGQVQQPQPPPQAAPQGPNPWQSPVFGVARCQPPQMAPQAVYGEQPHLRGSQGRPAGEVDELSKAMPLNNANVPWTPFAPPLPRTSKKWTISKKDISELPIFMGEHGKPRLFKTWRKKIADHCDTDNADWSELLDYCRKRAFQSRKER